MRKQNKRQVTTETLTIVDPDGNPRAVLTTHAGNPVLHFLDATKGDRLVIGLGPNGTPGIHLLREDASGAIGISLNEHDGSGIGISYSNGLPAIRMTLPASGSIEVEVYDASGRCLWKLEG